MRKIWTMAWKDIYSTYRDRNLVLIMIAAPLAVATIVGLAFGNLSGGDVPIKDIPVAIVNRDEGVSLLGNEQNYGAIFVGAFVPPAAGSSADSGAQQPACPAPEGQSSASADPNVLYDLTDAAALDDPDAARAGVDKGQYTAAIIIPPDFSRKIAYGPNDLVESTGLEVYANSGQAISAGIVRSIAEGIANQIATGNIAIAATMETTAGQYGVLQVGALAASERFSQSVACAFTPAFNTIAIDQQTVAGQKGNNAAAILVMVGSSQAMFFMLFNGQGTIASIFEERRQGTLQRIVVSPTPRVYILIGKLVGAFVNCVVQLVFLFIALTLVGSVLSGGFVLIWGYNLFNVALVIVAAALAATGLAIFLAGLTRTPEQAGMAGSVINLAMAVLGGAFGFALPEALARFSMIYWGTNAFSKLSQNQGDIGLNLVVLLAHAVVLFTIGYWLFNRRLDI